MPLFISVSSKYDHNYNQVEQTLVNLFGYNEAYWRESNGEIKVYYKNVLDLEHALNNL